MATFDAVRPGGRAGARWRGRAFGITIEADARLAGLVESHGDDDSGPVVTWHTVSTLTLSGEWKHRRDVVSLVDLRHPDGRRFLTIEDDPTLGYRISAPGYGHHVVTRDGSAIRSCLPSTRGLRWQRLFFAQVLPLAAALNGLDVFHASAVAIGGRAVALVGSSGAGKSSIAMHLVASGATSVTDDVLALEVTEGHLRAHPGAKTASIAPGELAALTPTQRRCFGMRVGPSEDAKVRCETVPITGPIPLGAVFFLQRDPAARALSITKGHGASTGMLLGAGFLSYLRPPARLAMHLEVCAYIASEVPTFVVQIPVDRSATETALRIQDDAAALGLWS